MLVWRLCKQRHAASAFSGIGAEKAGGHWNHSGDRMVDASSSLSLAALELFVHLDPDDMPDDLHFVAATIPDSASFEELTAAELPTNWRDFPFPSAMQDIGSRWLRERRTFLLIVPSAVNPEEKNILLNPLHPEAATLRPAPSKPFQFDPRMWK